MVPRFYGPTLMRDRNPSWLLARNEDYSNTLIRGATSYEFKWADVEIRRSASRKARDFERRDLVCEIMSFIDVLEWRVE